MGVSAGTSVLSQTVDGNLAKTRDHVPCEEFRPETFSARGRFH
jgi:hypothetical protein